MTTYIALVRGINVGGNRKVAMADLRRFFEELGFADVRTLLQSGNVVFREKNRSTAAIETELAAEAAARLDLHTQFFVRTAEEMAAVVAANPFPEWAEKGPAHLIVAFLSRVASAPSVNALRAAITGPELVKGNGREVYLVYPAGMGKSKLTNTILERKLGGSFTARNWNTVTKLAALAEA